MNQTNMPELFSGSRLKVQRANKHIREIQTILTEFANSDFYTVSIDYNPEQRTNTLCFSIDKTGFPIDDTALAIGDVLHNLRSALDHLWYNVVLRCDGRPTDWTRFPVFDAGEELVNAINAALKKKQITIAVAQFVLETIKPYYAGNPVIWGLHTLNIREKHEVLVPVLKLMKFTDVRLEDDNQGPVGHPLYLMDESSRIRLRDADGKRVTLKDKGHAATTILFDIRTPFEGKAVIPTLHGIAEEVARTVEAFNIMLT
jgi:hypothetical protein